MVASDEHEHMPDHGRGHVNRDRLVTTMLQDRSVVRIISAPSGYGKTELAREYADRLFKGKRVDWVDANTPDFIARLDDRRLARASFADRTTSQCCWCSTTCPGSTSSARRC